MADTHFLLFDTFRYTQPKPNLLLIDVLGDNIQQETNSEWRKLGERIAHHLSINNQTVVLFSTSKVEELTLTDVQSTPENSTSFDYKDKTYFITALETNQLDNTLPDIMETGEFVFGLNVWLVLFEEKKTAGELAEDEMFINEMKNMITNLQSLYELEMTYELITAESDGCEMLWFNSKIK